MSYLNNRDLTLTNNSSESQSESKYCSLLDLANIYCFKTFENGCLFQKNLLLLLASLFKTIEFQFLRKIKIGFSEPFNLPFGLDLFTLFYFDLRERQKLHCGNMWVRRTIGKIPYCRAAMIC